MLVEPRWQEDFLDQDLHDTQDQLQKQSLEHSLVGTMKKPDLSLKASTDQLNDVLLSNSDFDSEPDSPGPTGTHGANSSLRQQRTPLLGTGRGKTRRRLTSESRGELVTERAHSDPVFSAVLHQVETGIDANVQPEL